MARIASQGLISTTASAPSEIFYDGSSIRAIGIANTDTSTASVVKVSVHTLQKNAVSNFHCIWSIEVPAKSTVLYELNNSTITLQQDQRIFAVASGVTSSLYLIVDD